MKQIQVVSFSEWILYFYLESKQIMEKDKIIDKNDLKEQPKKRDQNG